MEWGTTVLIGLLATCPNYYNKVFFICTCNQKKMAVSVSTYTNNLTWNAASTDSSEWRSVTWGGPPGNKTFLAVTGITVTRPSRIATSTDGYEWNTVVQQPQAAFSTQVNKIIYDNVHKRYFGAGQGATGLGNNTLAFSTNSTGLAWVGLGKTLFNTGAFGLASNNKSLRLVAAGQGTNALSYSDVGTGGTWTGVTGTSIFSQANKTLWYGPQNLWVAVGQGTNTIATSPDGITWTGRGSSVFSTSGNCVAFNPTKALAMGAGGNTIAYSLNGTNWYGLGSTTFTVSGNSVIWTGSLWLGAGTGTNTLAYSRNGIIWFGLGSSIFSVAGRGFAVAPSMVTPFTLSTGVFDAASVSQVFVAVGEGTDNTLAYSNNGTVWFGLGNNLFTTAAYDVAYNGILFVAVGAGTNSIAWSLTGTNWTGVGTTVFTTGYSVTWTGERWVAVGAGANTVAWSTDGKVWTGLGTSVFSTLGRGIAPKLPEIVAVGNASGTNNSLAYSADGVVFTGINTFITQSINSVQVIANNGSTSLPLWLVGGNVLSYSNDGFSWTNYASFGGQPFTSQWNGLAYNVGVNNLWVGAGAGGNSLAWSSDGIAWVGVGSTTFSSNGQKVAFNTGLNNRWVAVGTGTNTIAYSDDGKTWTGLGNIIFSGSSGQGVGFSDVLSQWVVVGTAASANAIGYSNDNALTFTGVTGTSIFSTQGRGVAFNTGASGPTAVFVGKIDNGAASGAGTVLSVTSVTSGSIAVGMRITSTGGGGAIASNTVITAVNTASFTATIDNGSGSAGTTLTVTGVTSGTISAGMVITGAGIAAGTIIVSGSGTSWTVNTSQLVTPDVAINGLSYTVSNSQSITSSTMTGAAVATFLGSISTTTLTVSVPQLGAVQVGMGLVLGATANTVITAFVGTSTATFTGNITGTTLTVDAPSVVGTIAIGMGLTGTGVSANTIITAGSGTSWTVNNNQTVAAGTAFTASSSQYTVNTSQTVALGTSFIGSMARWVAVGVGTANTIAYSNDGVTWTGLGISIFSVQSNAVAYSPQLGIWVAVGSGGSFTIAYSTNGVTWTGVPNSLVYLSNGSFSVSWNGVSFLAAFSGVPTTGSQVYVYSTNGTNWYGYGATFTTQASNVAYSPEQNAWVAAGNSNITACYSANGVHWMNCSPSSFTMNTGIGVTWGSTPNLWILVGQSTIASIAYSSDGLSWTAATNPAFQGTTGGYDVLYAVDRFVAVGRNTTSNVTISYSFNGTNWLNYVGNSFNLFQTGRCIAFNPATNRLIAGGVRNNTLNSNTGFAVGFNTGSAATAIFIGSISGTTLTVTQLISGTVATNMALVGPGGVGLSSGVNTFVVPGTRITGGSGSSWTVSISQNVSSRYMTGTATFATFDGAISGTLFTVNSGTFVGGPVTVGMAIVGPTIQPGTVVTVVNTPGASFTVNIAQYATGTSCCATKNMFIFGGSGGPNNLAYSPDGQNWTGLGTIMFFSSGGCQGVAYSASQDLWVSVGAFNTGFFSIASSADNGVSWTGRATNTIFQTGYGVVFNTGAVTARWVAVGAVGTNNHTLAYSDDGINWVGLGNSFFTASGRSVAWASDLGRFVAVGISNATGGNCIAYSSNGITWFGVPTSGALFNSGCNTVAYGGAAGQKKFIVTGASSSNLNFLAYSSDGITWTAAAGLSISTSGSTVFWSDTQNIWLVGANPNISNSCYGYSYDGITWYCGSRCNVGGPFSRVAYGLNTFVASGYTSDAACVGYAFEEAANSNGDFRWTGNSYNTLASSDDLGVTWTPVPWSATMNTCYTVCYNSNNNRWFAGSTNTTNVACLTYSDNNGVNWNNFVYALYGVKWVPRLNKFVAVSHNNFRAYSVIVTSTDGEDWTWENTGTLNTLSLTNVYNSVADNNLSSPNGVTLVAGRGSVINNSINSCYVYRLLGTGTTWTRFLVPYQVSAVVYAPFSAPAAPAFILAGGNTAALSFDNGLTWSPTQLFADNMNISNAVWSPDLGKVCVISNSTSFPVGSVAVTSDGVTWQYGTISANSYGPLEWSSTFKVFVTLIADTAKNQQQCMISADGLNWYNSNTLNTNNTFNGIAWSDELGMFCGVGYQSTLRPYVFVTKLLT